jgi:signal transduction histidine kinase
VEGRGLSLDLALRYATWAVYVAVFLLVVRRALRTPTPAHRDIAFFFGASVVLIGFVSAGTVLAATPPRWVVTATAIVAMLLPYLLLRVVAGFAQTPTWLLRAAEIGWCIASVAAILASDPAPPAVTVLLVLYFLSVAGYDTTMLVRTAGASAGVTRQRMLAAGVGSAALALAAAFSAGASLDGAHIDAWTILSRLMALASAVGYYVGFAPPSWLRRAWQAPALQTFLDEVTRLPYLPDLPSVLTELEAHATAVIGAPSAAIGMWQANDGVLRFWRGLGPRPPSPPYPPDLSRRGFVPHDEVIDVRPERLLSGRAFLQQRPLFAADVQREDPDNASLYALWDVRAVLAAPISMGQQRLGVLTVWSPRAPVFAESDLEVMQLLARQAAAVLGSRLLLEQLSEARAREEADRLKDAFLASISHDLRNPLTAVSAITQLLNRNLERTGSIEPERLRASLNSLQGSAAQMTHLVDQLLDYARLRLDRPLELNRQPTDLVAVTRRVVAAHEGTSERHRVLFDPVVPSLVGLWDEERLERVLQNLIGNAIKYSPSGGDINVRVWREQAGDARWAVVAVQDPGVGIPPAELPRLFEQFYRATNVTGRLAGTGIGLTTARQLVEQHGGRIDVESEEGRGSTFTVRLPLGGDDGSSDGGDPVPEDQPRADRLSAHGALLPASPGLS